jgi:hypothetical protein
MLLQRCYQNARKVLPYKVNPCNMNTHQPWLLAFALYFFRASIIFFRASIIGLTIIPSATGGLAAQEESPDAPLAAAHSDGFLVGTGLRIITPDPLLPVSGGVGIPREADGKRGELTARAMVFRNGEVTVAIVSLDLLGFPAVLGDRVRKQVPRIPADHILIGATHTHSAPDCYAFPDPRGGHTGNLEYNAQILTIPGEALPNIGFYLKRKMHGEHTLLFGLTNDAFGYILTKVDLQSFPRYDYVTRTSLGEMTGEILIENYLDLISQSPAARQAAE